jgi:hypothetical protein
MPTRTTITGHRCRPESDRFGPPFVTLKAWAMYFPETTGVLRWLGIRPRKSPPLYNRQEWGTRHYIVARVPIGISHRFYARMNSAV